MRAAPLKKQAEALQHEFLRIILRHLRAAAGHAAQGVVFKGTAVVEWLHRAFFGAVQRAVRRARDVRAVFARGGDVLVEQCFGKHEKASFPGLARCLWNVRRSGAAFSLRSLCFTKKKNMKSGGVFSVFISIPFFVCGVKPRMAAA